MKTNQLQKNKVLIVEDEGDMCLLLNIMLSGKGTELDHVKTLSAAENYLRKEQPPVVIMDNMLPDGFGVDFISHIKSNYPDIKIIMISGLAASKEIALTSGADIFLEKPFHKETLYTTLNSLLN